MSNVTISKLSDGTNIGYIAPQSYFECSTAAATAAKTATSPDSVVFSNTSLSRGTTVFVKFTNENTADSPTLQIGTSTAKSISGSAKWSAGSVVSFTYDGTNWIQGSGDSSRGEKLIVTLPVVESSGSWVISPTASATRWQFTSLEYIDSSTTPFTVSKWFTGEEIYDFWKDADLVIKEYIVSGSYTFEGLNIYYTCTEAFNEVQCSPQEFISNGLGIPAYAVFAGLNIDKKITVNFKVRGDNSAWSTLTYGSIENAGISTVVYSGIFSDDPVLGHSDFHIVTLLPLSLTYTDVLADVTAHKRVILSLTGDVEGSTIEFVYSGSFDGVIVAFDAITLAMSNDIIKKYQVLLDATGGTVFSDNFGINFPILLQIADIDTTYTFTGGTDSFTAEDSFGNTSTVTITPSAAALSGVVPTTKGGTGIAASTVTWYSNTDLHPRFICYLNPSNMSFTCTYNGPMDGISDVATALASPAVQMALQSEVPVLIAGTNTLLYSGTIMTNTVAGSPEFLFILFPDGTTFNYNIVNGVKGTLTYVSGATPELSLSNIQINTPFWWHNGNMVVANGIGDIAIGSSTTPVYWTGSAFTPVSGSMTPSFTTDTLTTTSVNSLSTTAGPSVYTGGGTVTQTAFTSAPAVVVTEGVITAASVHTGGGTVSQASFTSDTTAYVDSSSVTVVTGLSGGGTTVVTNIT